MTLLRGLRFGGHLDGVDPVLRAVGDVVVGQGEIGKLGIQLGDNGLQLLLLSDGSIGLRSEVFQLLDQG